LLLNLLRPDNHLKSVRRQFLVFIAIIQSILFFGHWFLYETLIFFWQPASPAKLRFTLAILSVTFVLASWLAFHRNNFFVRLVYTASVVWLGFASFFFFASWACWIAYLAARLFGFHPAPHSIALVFYGSAVLAGFYGMINASFTRVKKISVNLPNLPESWRGRVAALVSDTHLGHVRNHGFLRRIIALLGRLQPDVIFIGGDLYDGTAADLERLAQPWADLAPPLGTYFVAGNHDGFTGHAKHVAAVKNSGVRVLDNEKVTVDGLQIVGVHYRDSVDAQRFRSILRSAGLDRDRASILLTHAPSGLPIAEQEGISLHLSGHTHGGQIFPFTWIVSRVWGQFTYGLKRLGNMFTYTSSGAGTWGPPMRVGTTPEIVLITFE
jgi:predicted MPP superfamily phosphohydrolase